MRKVVARTAQSRLVPQNEGSARDDGSARGSRLQERQWHEQEAGSPLSSTDSGTGNCRELPTKDRMRAGDGREGRSMTPEHLLRLWLDARLPVDARCWLAEAAQRLRDGTDTDLYRLVSLVTRKIGKTDLALTAVEMHRAAEAREGWDPSDWSIDQAARIYLLLVSATDGATFLRRLDQLCNTADIGELVAFYRGLPLYPDQPRYVLRAAEGIRSNMKAVFEAVAHRNPYPTEQLSEPAWNQMVLKALFVGSTLHPIVGLDRRTNAALARMACNYAHERWAAGRQISPELWRCVGPHASGDMLGDLRHVLETGTDPERKAAALALASSPDPSAALLLGAYPELSAAISEDRVSWQKLAGSG